MVMQHTRLPRTLPAATQRQAVPVPAPAAPAALPQHRLDQIAANRTGLPDRLKTGIEALSGVSMDGVRVRYNSPHPARIGALAYARGREIHLAAGQEQHLPHEAWHLVQQAQGRVRATMQAKGGVAINDDRHLEREADVMGARALAGGHTSPAPAASGQRIAASAVAQPMLARFGARKVGGGTASFSRGFSSGGGGGGGKPPWRPPLSDDKAKQHAQEQAAKKLARQQKAEADAALRRQQAELAARTKEFDLQMRRQQAEAAAREKALKLQEKQKSAAAKLIPRALATTFGPELGYLQQSGKTFSRATVNTDDILKSLDKTGFTSAATRNNAPPDNSPVTDSEITAYSGVQGKPATYKNSRLVGLNKDTRHTLDVASGTSGEGSLQKFIQSSKTSNAGRLDEVDGQNLDLHSVEDAFNQTGEKNKWPVSGEFVSPTTIPTSAFGHTAIFPLSHPLQQEQLGSPGQVHPDYLRNLGLATGASLEAPQSFIVKTKTHRNKKLPGGSVELDSFLEPPQKTNGREKQLAAIKTRLQKKLAAKKKREEKAKTKTE